MPSKSQAAHISAYRLRPRNLDVCDSLVFLRHAALRVDQTFEAYAGLYADAPVFEARSDVTGNMSCRIGR